MACCCKTEPVGRSIAPHYFSKAPASAYSAGPLPWISGPVSGPILSPAASPRYMPASRRCFSRWNVPRMHWCSIHTVGRRSSRAGWGPGGSSSPGATWPAMPARMTGTHACSSTARSTGSPSVRRFRLRRRKVSWLRARVSRFCCARLRSRLSGGHTRRHWSSSATIPRQPSCPWRSHFTSRDARRWMCRSIRSTSVPRTLATAVTWRWRFVARDRPRSPSPM